MPRAIVIHAGFHKTGTSSVQHMLRRNRATLKPHLAIRLKPQVKDLLHAARGYSTWGDQMTLWKLERRFKALVQSLPGMPRRVLCLSAEELSGHMPGRGDLVDYRAAPVLAARYAAICAKLFPGVPVRFCYGTREAQSWLGSAWAEHVKSSSLTLDFDAFAARYQSAADLDAVVAQVAEVTGCETRAMPLNANDIPGLPLLDLCEVPRSVQAEIEHPAPVNTRLPDGVLLDLLAANRAYADRDARKAAKAAILKEAGYE